MVEKKLTELRPFMNLSKSNLQWGYFADPIP